MRQLFLGANFSTDLHANAPNLLNILYKIIDHHEPRDFFLLALYKRIYGIASSIVPSFQILNIQGPKYINGAVQSI